MKRTQGVRVVALVCAIVCLLVWAPAQAGASTTQGDSHDAAVTAATSGSAAAGTSPFSKKDLMALAAGATALVAFGVGFRRISAPLE